MDQNQPLVVLNYCNLTPLCKGCTHRVDRVLGFFSSRPSWDPLTCRQVCPPSFRSGGGTHPLAGEGGSQLERGYRHCGTQGIYALCGCTYSLWWRYVSGYSQVRPLRCGWEYRMSWAGWRRRVFTTGPAWHSAIPHLDSTSQIPARPFSYPLFSKIPTSRLTVPYGLIQLELQKYPSQHIYFQ